MFILIWRRTNTAVINHGQLIILRSHCLTTEILTTHKKKSNHNQYELLLWFNHISLYPLFIIDLVHWPSWIHLWDTEISWQCEKSIMLTVICRSWAFKWLKSESHIASLCVATLAQCGNRLNLTQKSYQCLSVRQRTDNHQQLGFRAEVFKWQNISSVFTIIFSITITLECITCTNKPFITKK